MARNLNVPVDDETYDRLEQEKKERGLTWPDFIEEVSHEVAE